MIRIMGGGEPPTPTMEIVDVTPEEAARNLELHQIAVRNLNWFGERAVQIGQEHPGRHIAVAGGELLVGDNALEVYERAKAAHPDEAGAVFTKYIRPLRGTIHAN